MIVVSNLRKEFESAVPLEDVSITVNDGEIVAVIGPSGTGKSTLLRCLNMLDKPTSGTVTVDGITVTDKKCRLNKVRQKMGMVFQSYNLFDHLTVVENIMYPQMDLLKTKRADAYKKAIELLRTVGLESRALQYPDELSGGQKQRVAIARALSTNPDIILLDEPTSALDPTMVGEVQGVIRELAKTGKTMIIVTHAMRFAKEICTRVLYMDKGGVYEDGTPSEIFGNPKKELTRRFVRRLKVFEVTVNDGFDFLGNQNDIESFGYKNRISPKTVYRLQAVFEELCQQILLSRSPAGTISFVAEYDEANETVTATVKYGGEQFDPRIENNGISWRIIENNACNIEHFAVNDEGYTNKLTFTIEKK